MVVEEQNEELQEAEEKDELSSVLDGESEVKEEVEEKEEVEVKTEVKEEGEAEDKKEEVETETEPDFIKVLQEEVKDLRQMVRTSKRELTQTQAKLERVSGRTKDEEEDEEEEGKGEKKESLSAIEELQRGIANVGALKGASLDILLETMEQSPKYEDIREVCSRGNFDDIFEVIATDITKNGGNFDEALLEAELSVWNKPNPYKYMYDLIKQYHPSYVKKESVASPEVVKKSKNIKEVKAPGTIADKGGDSNLRSGWTSKRIDDLPEDELGTVPKEIYAKYMKDELD